MATLQLDYWQWFAVRGFDSISSVRKHVCNCHKFKCSCCFYMKEILAHYQTSILWSFIGGPTVVRDCLLGNWLGFPLISWSLCMWVFLRSILSEIPFNYINNSLKCHFFKLHFFLICELQMRNNTGDINESWNFQWAFISGHYRPTSETPSKWISNCNWRWKRYTTLLKMLYVWRNLFEMAPLF